MDRWLRTPILPPLATAILVIAAIALARPVLAPLAVAGLLSVVAGGAVTRVERLRFGGLRPGRVGSVLVVVLGIGAIFAVTAWIVAREGSDFAERLPAYQRTLQQKAREPVRALRSAVRQIRNGTASNVAPSPSDLELVPRDSELVGFAAGWVGSIASLATTTGIVFVLLIFLLIERESLRDRILRLFGPDDLRLTGSTLREASERVARYLRALTLLNFGHGLAVGVGLALLGLPGALLFGLLAGLLRFVPYAGPLIAAAAPLAISLAAFDGWTMFVWVALFLATLELVSNNFFEPWLYGSSVGLSPFAVILSAIFWAWLWGPIGLVLATPLTVCLVVLGRHIPAFETMSILLSDIQPLSPGERVYERLLARDLDSATALVTDQVRDQSIVETWDTTLIPALQRLERDRRTHDLDAEDVAFAREAFESWIGDLPDPTDPDAACAGTIVFLPAAPFGDEIVAAGLARVLECRGFETRSVPRSPTAELVEFANRHEGAVLLLSALDSRTTPIRNLVRRLRVGARQRRILVGFWGIDPARLAERRAAFSDDAGVEIVTSVDEAVRALSGDEAHDDAEAHSSDALARAAS